MTTPPESLGRAERLLFDLVSTPSVSGGERAAAEVFVRHAQSLGLDAEIDEAGNALAHRGPREAGTHVVLLGHIDTVPGHIPVRVEGGVLHGRGAVDAKGPLAAMLAAGAQAGLPPGVRLTVAGAVGEETPGSPGARHLVRQFRPSACIIGEPSGWDGVTLGYKGRLLVTATATHANHHSAADEASACDAVFAWWARARAHVDRLNRGRQGVFHAVQATVLGLRSGGDGLEQTASLDAGFRLGPGDDPHGLAQALAALADGSVETACTGMELAHATDRNDPVVRCLGAAIRRHGARPRPKLKTGTADLNVVAPVWGCPIAAYGPGDSTLDHTPHERLSLAEFARSVGVLTDATAQLARELVGTPDLVHGGTRP